MRTWEEEQDHAKDETCWAQWLKPILGPLEQPIPRPAIEAEGDPLEDNEDDTRSETGSDDD